MTLPATPDDRRALADAIGSWEERAAILEYEAGMRRVEAEARATAELGYAPAWRGSILKVIDTCGP